MYDEMFNRKLTISIELKLTKINSNKYISVKGVKKGFRIRHILTGSSGSLDYHLKRHQNSKCQSEKFINNASTNIIPFKSLSDSN